MRAAYNHAGKQFGFLTPLKLLPTPRGENGAHWLCRCACGNEKVIKAKSFVSGHTIGCGCRMGGLRHGLSFTKTHRAWAGMIQRCTNPNVDSYRRYGARGIKVCERWMHSFDNFLHDMGQAPLGLTLERIDNDKDYEPGNCKWDTVKVQANNRRSNHKITFRGVVKNITEWARDAGLSQELLGFRLRSGWSMERAMATKPQLRKPQKSQMQMV